MKRKLIMVVMVCTILVALCGCDKHIKDKIYDTDVYGTYEKSGASDDNDTKYYFSLSINDDSTYSYRMFEHFSSRENDNTVSGNISSTIELNNDITKIVFDDIDYSSFDDFVFCGWGMHGNTLYKYKNLLGDYFQIETSQIKNRSSFSIPMDSSGEYYLRFTEDGMCKSDNTPDEEQYYYKYKVKSDVIFIDYGYGYGAAYYIVDGGVFDGNGFHKSE